MAEPPVAVLDANVLYPPVLRDIMIATALAGLYQARWSEGILGELERNLALRIGSHRAERRVQLLRGLLPEAMVEDYGRHLPDLKNNAKDGHVVAAALAGEASVIVTANLKHFSPLPPGLRAALPDTFLCGFLGDMPVLQQCLEQVRLNWPKPPPQSRLLDQLEVLAPQFAEELRSAL
jgi:hypothetical protein